jgi:predicted DNA binding CopG/RHH family protein
LKRKVPKRWSDAAAEAFLDQDLSKADLTPFRSARCEFDGRVKAGYRATAQLNKRLPESLLDAVKQRASARGISYRRFSREAVEHAPANLGKSRRHAWGCFDPCWGNTHPFVLYHCGK